MFDGSGATFWLEDLIGRDASGILNHSCRAHFGADTEERPLGADTEWRRVEEFSGARR